MFQLKSSILIAVALFAIHCAENPSAKPQEATPPPSQLSPQEEAMRAMEKNWKPAYTIDIDSVVFNHSRVGVYTSDKYDKAAISVVIMPMESFLALKTKFLSRKPREGEVEKFKGVVKMDGRDVLVSKMLVNQEGLELAVQLYQVAGSDNQVIAVTCASKPGDEAGLTPLFEKAVKSVKLK